MATIRKGTIQVAYNSTEYEQTMLDFCDKLEEALDEAGIEYDHTYESAKEREIFKLLNKTVTIEFHNFHQKTSGDSGINPERIYLGLKASGPLLFQGENSTGADSFPYEIIVSSYGDVLLRLGQGVNYINQGVIFGICRCNNTVNPSQSDIGIYVPFEMGNNYSSTGAVQNCTPKYLVTNDTDLTVAVESNVGNITGSMTAMNMILNTNAAITVLSPIYAVSSQCVSINTKIMAVAPSPITGYATLNGQRYYCVGMVCMADDEE